jgi:hypothetical protein
MPKTSPTSAVDVVTQLVTGPSLQEVATKTLRPALKTLYPDLDIDPQQAMVVRPTWLIDNDQVVPGRSQIESLSDALVRLGLSGTTVTYLDGEHFLTLRPELESTLHLPVKIDAIGCLLNELAPLLFVAYKEQQVNYWDEFTYPGQPRWQQLSDALRGVWNVDASVGWDTDQLAMAAAVYNNPDQRQRLSTDRYKTRACLIDFDQSDADTTTHLTLLDTAVLIGTVAERTLILTYSVIQGFQCFDSLDELGEALPRRFWHSAANASGQWRLVEPQGNFFDQQACTLIALEAEALGEINFFSGSTSNPLYPHAGTAGNPRQPTPRLEPHFERLQPMLPAWLNSAPAADQSRYSRHLLDLTTVQHSNHGQSFQSEVASLQTFTRDALTLQLRKDHPTASDVEIDEIEISITSLVVWGTFVLPGHTQTKTLSLTELALQNLAEQPLGNKTLRYRDDSALPDWLSVAYVEKLVSAVDIGKTYPQHLKTLLIDDSAKAATLQTLYTSQLASELPLLALQQKIQGMAGLSELGYRYVVAALANTDEGRHVDLEEIVIRPLAFVAHRSSAQADTVNNMFVIGPRDASKGPCVLYRPLFEMVLLEYSSHANLLYAIQHSRHLRESVLAWLADDVRFNYSQFVFTAQLPSVWIIPQLLINPTTALDMSGPVALSSAAIESDVLATLHRSNVDAIITQADRQSVSNAEARWATLKSGGWMLFNAALPFLGRSIGMAAWLWQIMDDLQEVSDVANQQSGETAWTAIADILLALGMVLAHRAAFGNKPQPEPLSAAKKNPLIVEPAPAISKPLQLPDVTDTQLSGAHAMSINVVTALQRSPVALAALLDTFNIARPRGLGSAATAGTHQYLHAHNNRWYAPVGQRWFEVLVNEHGDVQITDSRQRAPRAGPLLSHLASGQWVIDLRMRLRGGGLESRLKKSREKKTAIATTLTNEIKAFDQTMDAKQTQLDADHVALRDAPPEAQAQALKNYLSTLDTQARAYGANIEKIKALNPLNTVPNYRTTMIQRLEMQLFLGQEWLTQQAADYQATLKTMTTMLEDEASHAPQAFTVAFENMTDLSQGIIEKVESAQTRFDELRLLGKEAVEVLHTYQRALPNYNLNDLKLLQICLGQEISVKPGASAMRTRAYEAVKALLEDAALNIQSSLNLTADESLSDLRERIDALNTVSEQFTAVDQRFADVLSTYAEQINSARLEHVRHRVSAFRARTDERLADLLRNKHLLEQQPGPSRPATASVHKIIKTKLKGTLVGKRKKTTNGEDSDLVEVRTTLSGVIATFREESPGVWVEQGTPTPPRPAITPKPGLNKSVREGQTLLDGLAVFHRQMDARIKQGTRLPVEIEEEYYRQASLLRKANAAIDEALTVSNLTADLKAPTEALGHALDQAAKTLEDKGTSARIKMIKQRPPTAAGVEWLKDQKQVTIAQTVTRRRLRGHANDFLDEYAIRDAHTDKVLCYAHFHYPSADAAVVPFPAGHMKTVAQQRLGGAYEPSNLNNQELIDIYRSKISRQSAEALFFTPATPAATGSTPL